MSNDLVACAIQARADAERDVHVGREWLIAACARAVAHGHVVGVGRQCFVELHGGGIGSIARALPSIPSYQLRIELKSVAHLTNIPSGRAERLRDRHPSAKI